MSFAPFMNNFNYNRRRLVVSNANSSMFEAPNCWGSCLTTSLQNRIYIS